MSFSKSVLTAFTHHVKKMQTTVSNVNHTQFGTYWDFETYLFQCCLAFLVWLAEYPALQHGNQFRWSSLRGYGVLHMLFCPWVCGAKEEQQLQHLLSWHVLIAAAFSFHRLVLATTAPAKHTEPSSVLSYTDVILNRCWPILFIHSSY